MVMPMLAFERFVASFVISLRNCWNYDGGGGGDYGHVHGCGCDHASGNVRGCEIDAHPPLRCCCVENVHDYVHDHHLHSAR